MNDEIRAILKWQIDNLEEYKLALERKGMIESVETVNFVIQTTKQFLDNPKMIDYILKH